MKKTLFNGAFTVSMAIALSACGSKAPRPDAELALANSALKSAELSDARTFAPIELRAAREKKAAADKAIAKKQYAKAKYLTIEARADADLARAVADAKRTNQELQRAEDTLQDLHGDSVPVSNNKN